MKKIIYLVAISAICAIGCTKEVQQQEETKSEESKELVMLSFTASSEFTKAYLNSDRSVSFRAGDKISVFANGTNYELTTAEGGDKAVFTGLGETADTYYALYPYSADATIDGDKIKNVVIGSGSYGTGTGTFNSKKAVSVAVSTGENLYFKQITSLLKITVPAEVTDLTEIVMFNRDNNASNYAGAISGTFNVTPSAEGRPVVEVTSAAFQAGIKGPISESPFPAGDYYLPILPATLTDTKGFDLKLAFSDMDGRAFSGIARTFEACQVYDLGTIRKVNEYVDNGFEQQNITDYTGNTGALSVIENPFKTSVNPSNYVLKNQVSGTGPTSGYIDIASGAAAGLRKFPSSVRDKYDKIRIKIYLGSNAYYPRLRRGSTDAPAAKLNGIVIDSNKGTWVANVKTDDWNLLEFNASDMTDGWKDFGSLANYQIRPMVDWDGNNVSGYDADTNNRCVYIDDITFVLK